MKHSREGIISQGREIFRKYGYHATGVSTILEECGISKGTFYNYFESKEAFALESLRNYSSQIQKLITTYMGFTTMSPSKRIKRYFEQLIKINEQEGSDKGCLLMNFMVEMGGSETSFAKHTSEEFSKWIDLLAPTIEEAQNNKEITNSYPAKQIATFLYLQFYGLFANMKANQSTNRMKSLLNMTFDFVTS